MSNTIEVFSNIFITDEKSHDSAREVTRLGDNDECGGEGEEGADDEDTAELPGAGPDHRGVPVSPQHPGGDGGHQQTRPGEEQRPQGPGVGVVQVDLRSQDAVLGVGGVSDHLHHAVGALKLRLDIFVIVTGLTVPTASVIEAIRYFYFILVTCLLIAFDKVLLDTSASNSSFELRI